MVGPSKGEINCLKKVYNKLILKVFLISGLCFVLTLLTHPPNV
jgi:hypothetical protein